MNTKHDSIVTRAIWAITSSFYKQVITTVTLKYFQQHAHYGVSLVPKLTHARKRLFECISGFRKREFLLRTQF